MLCYFLNVYSPCNLAKKRSMWLEILNWKSSLEVGEWLVGVISMFLGIGWKEGVEVIVLWRHKWRILTA